MERTLSYRLQGRKHNSTAGGIAGVVLALTAALLAAGCGGNSPRTERPSGAEMTDEAVTWAVERDLRNHDAVDAHLVQVRTSEGVVTLSGTVSNVLAEERAIRLAETTRGVRAVVDELAVRPVTAAGDTVRTRGVRS